jgi:hypothetical protein
MKEDAPQIVIYQEHLPTSEPKPRTPVLNIGLKLEYCSVFKT